MNKSIVLFFVTSTLLCCAGSPSSGRDLAALGLYSSPQKIIDTLDRENAAYAEHYMLGRAYLEKNDHKKAIFHFANSAFVYQRAKKLRLFAGPVYKFLNEFHIKSDYYDDAVYAIAKIFYSFREFEHVVKLVDLIEKKPSALVRDALVLKAKTLSELDRDNDALESLQEGFTTFKEKSAIALLHIRRASTYMHAKDETKALNEYFLAIDAAPESWYTTVAAEQIFLLSKKNTLSFPAERKIILAKALYRAGKYDDSASLFGELSTAAHSIPDDATEYHLKTLVRIKQFDSVDKIIASAQKRKKDREYARIAADELWDSGQQAVSVGHYRKLANGSDEIARHALSKLCTYSEKRKLPGFENLLRDFITKYPHDEQSSLFSWLLTRSYIRNSDFNSAYPIIEKSLADSPDGKYSDHLRFWLYRIMINEGRKGDAMAVLSDMAEKNPDSSYTWSLLDSVSSQISHDELMSAFENCSAEKCRMLYHALLTVKENDLSRTSARWKKYSLGDRKQYQQIESSISSLALRSDYESNLKSLKKYFAVGDADSISRELSLLPDDDEVKNDTHIALAYFSEKYGFYHRGTYSTLQLFRYAKIPINFFLMEPRTIQRLYPKAYFECVKNAAKKHGFDIPTLYALIRAESLYNHEAHSPAGAVGLMQIMPATARGIAKELASESYDLKDPCTSIEFGAHYFKRLQKMYNGKIELMIAAYNAGPGNVAKWLEKHPSDDLHFFIEQVPFDETRYYMLRTKKNYLQGKIVYGEK